MTNSSLARSLILCVLVVGSSRPLSGQSSPSLPRSMTDTSFALRLALNEMQDLVQTGARPRTLALDTAFDNAGQQLRLARVARHRALPTTHASALWDFHIDVQDIRPAGANRWVAYATISLDQDTTAASANVSLVFARTGQGWQLTDTRDLRAILHAMRDRLIGGQAP
jgi:hypothetical protein